MTRPAVGSTSEQLFDALGALGDADEDVGWHLLSFCDALCTGCGFEQLNTYVADRDDLPGWAAIFDPNLCPDEALPYLAQFVGVQFDPRLTETERRAALIAHEGWRRGTPAAMISAAQRTLTGGKN